MKNVSASCVKCVKSGPGVRFKFVASLNWITFPLRMFDTTSQQGVVTSHAALTAIGNETVNDQTRGPCARRPRGRWH